MWLINRPDDTSADVSREKAAGAALTHFSTTFAPSTNRWWDLAAFCWLENTPLWLRCPFFHISQNVCVESKQWGKKSMQEEPNYFSLCRQYLIDHLHGVFGCSRFTALPRNCSKCQSRWVQSGLPLMPFSPAETVNAVFIALFFLLFVLEINLKKE